MEDSRNNYLEGKHVLYGIKDVWTIEDQGLDGGRRDLLAWIFLDLERAHQQRLVIESKMMEFEAMASRRPFNSETAAQLATLLENQLREKGLLGKFSLTKALLRLSKTAVMPSQVGLA